MISKTPGTAERHRGFMALTAVIMLASGALVFAAAAAAAAAAYADAVARREWRVQASLDVESCLETAALLLARNVFLAGQVRLPEPDCLLDFSNDFNGPVTVSAKATVADVTATGKAGLQIGERSVTLYQPNIDISP